MSLRLLHHLLLCHLRHFYFVDDLAITSIRLRNPEDDVMLLLTADIPGEHDRTIIDLRVYFSAFQGRFGLEMTCDLLLNLFAR